MPRRMRASVHECYTWGRQYFHFHRLRALSMPSRGCLHRSCPRPGEAIRLTARSPPLRVSASRSDLCPAHEKSRSGMAVPGSGKTREPSSCFDMIADTSEPRGALHPFLQLLTLFFRFVSRRFHRILDQGSSHQVHQAHLRSPQPQNATEP